MRERVLLPSPDSLTDARYLAARFWKAAGPRKIASSRSGSVTGPHSAGSPGSRGVEVQGLLADSTSGSYGGETRDPSPLPSAVAVAAESGPSVEDATGGSSLSGQ